MPHLLMVGLAAVLLWSLVAHRFERWGVAGPAALLVLGALTVGWDTEAFTVVIDSPVAEKIVEVILAILLFIDAIEVKGGVFGGEGRVVSRLVLLALPLSLIAAAVTAAAMLPEAGVLVAIIIACVVMPTDFAPATQILRSKRLPARLRRILNVESGYNDGLVSPLFGMALALGVLDNRLSSAGGEVSEADLEEPVAEFLVSFFNAVPATLVAIVIGVVIGGGIGLLVRAARRRDIANVAGARYVMLLVPLVVYSVATLPVFSANGFVAAFAAGVCYRLMRTRGEPKPEIAHDELVLVEETGVLASHLVWFVLGGVVVVVFASEVSPWEILFALLALTLLRIVPVYISLLGSSVARGDRVLIGSLGPRGTASIVFGLLAFNALEDVEQGLVVLTVMVTVVVGSILLHGVVAPLALRRSAKRAGTEAADAR